MESRRTRPSGCRTLPGTDTPMPRQTEPRDRTRAMQRPRRSTSLLRLLVDVDQVTRGEVLVADLLQLQILTPAPVLDPELGSAA